MLEPDILVLGGSGTGKTHFAGQLLGRMRHDRRGKLRIRPGGVKDLTKLEEVLDCLEQGKSAGHTPADTWTGIRCELESQDGKNVLLEWPEYAGERLFSIVERRTMPDEWRKSTQSASGWLLFIRLSTVNLYEDLLVRPTGTPPKHASSNWEPIHGDGWDDRARYVELLQMLLFASQRTTYRRLKTPRLAVVLSCWDELKEEIRSPGELLSERLPLLDAFVRNTWREGASSVWGLSSLGRALSQSAPDSDYLEQGPENFGYVVPPGSSVCDSDLTVPLAWLLGL